MTTATAAPAAPPGRDWWVLTGMTVAATSATLASFSGLRGLAVLAGWPDHLAWLLPVTLDAYAMTAARVWLAATTGTRAARRFARANALGAIGASIAGNATYHAATTGLLHLSWPIVVTVGAVPAAILGLTAHLHALQGRTGTDSPTTPSGPNTHSARPDSQGRAEDGASPAPAPAQAGPEVGPIPARPPAAKHDPGRRRTVARRPPRYRTEADLLAAARAADADFRSKHGGRPITRDALRDALRVSGSRASELRRAIQAAETGPAAAEPTQQEAAS